MAAVAPVEQRIYGLADQYLAQARQQLAAEGYEDVPPSMLVEEVMNNTGARWHSPAFRDLVTMKAGGANNAQIQPFAQYWKNKGGSRDLGLNDYYHQYGVTDRVVLQDGGIYDGGDRSTGYGGVSRVDARDRYGRPFGVGAGYGGGYSGHDIGYNGSYNSGYMSQGQFAPHYGRNFGNTPGVNGPLPHAYGGYYGPGSGQWGWSGGPYGQNYNYGNSRAYSSPPAYNGYGSGVAGAPYQNQSPYGRGAGGYGGGYGGGPYPLGNSGGGYNYGGQNQRYNGGYGQYGNSGGGYQQGYGQGYNQGYNQGGYGATGNALLDYYSPESPSNPFIVRGVGTRVGLRPIAQGLVQMGLDRLPRGFNIESNSVVAYAMDAAGYPRQRIGSPFTLPVVQQGMVMNQNGVERTLSAMLRQFELWMQYHIPLQRQAQMQMQVTQNAPDAEATVQPGTNPAKINITMGRDGLPLRN